MPPGRTRILHWLSCEAVLLLLLLYSGRNVTAADWPTFGRNPQRSSWAEEGPFSPENVSGLELKWATQLENVPLALNSLTAPVVASNVVTAKGIRTVVYVAGSSDTFFALDSQDGKVLWNQTFDSAVLPGNESFYLYGFVRSSQGARWNCVLGRDCY